MKIYLAAQFSWKDDIAKKKVELEHLGHVVTSTWSDETMFANCSLKDLTNDYATETAYRDLLEIGLADALVLFTVDPDTPTRRGGRHVEFGYAMGLSKRVFVIGPRENIFHHVTHVQQFNTWDDFLASL